MFVSLHRGLDRGPMATVWLVLRSLSAALILSAVAPVSALAAAADSMLVDVGWLKQHRADVLLLDASLTSQHRTGHIAGAVSTDMYRYGPDEPSRQAMVQRMQSWGISPGRKIVVYDQGGDWMAARLFHDLYVHGVPAQDLHLLDGGLAAWKAGGGEVSTTPAPAPLPGTWQLRPFRSEERVLLPEFLAASGDLQGHALVDALSPSYYYGQQRFFSRAGHVPGAVSLPSEDFFGVDQRFKSAEEIRRLLRYHGIRADQDVLAHCGGGGAAAVPWFALRFLVDHPKARLYLGSQREWLRDDRGLPFWTYSAPQMLRDAEWLSGWNAPMLRMFGVANLNVVDVRGTATYARGHLPYAVSLPADALRAQIGQPQALAALFAAAGVNPGHEVVLVSEQGLTPDAAVAYLAFQQMRHGQVSLLLDTVDDWALRGFELTRQPTRVGAPRGMDDMAVPPTDYLAPAALHGALIARDSAAQGEFGRVFVATGRAAPTQPLAGKLVHLPYPALLAAGGQPKAAAELWSLIEKAGIPRHAELVFVADDMAEAAVGYVIFKLMGWPDLKVMALR